MLETNGLNEERQEQLASWLQSLAPDHSGYLARAYFSLTSNYAPDFLLNNAEARAKLIETIHLRDFPVRNLARLVQIVAVLDFVFRLCGQSTDSSELHMNAVGEPNAKVIDFQSALWNKTVQSWNAQRERFAPTQPW
ncbi:MAG: hypothetical protein ACOCWR_05965 [Oceanidesulfovibrio sp.]